MIWDRVPTLSLHLNRPLGLGSILTGSFFFLKTYSLCTSHRKKKAECLPQVLCTLGLGSILTGGSFSFYSFSSSKSHNVDIEIKKQVHSMRICNQKAVRDVENLMHKNAKPSSKRKGYCWIINIPETP